MSAIVLVTALAGAFAAQTSGQTVDQNAVKSKISEKAQELNKINQQILEQQKKLQETQTEKRSLSSEVKKLDTTLSQISLSIKSSEVAISKLDLELDDLHGNMTDAERDIRDKSAAVGDILRSIQDNDTDNALLVMMRNKTLSEGLLKIQSLMDLNQDLLVKIDDLRESHNRLKDAAAKTEDAKQQKENESENFKNRKIIAADLKSEKDALLRQTKQKESEYQKSLSDLEKRQNDIGAEIEAMEAQLRTKIDYSELPSGGVLLTPVSGPITQGYGSTAFAQKAYKGKWHNGYDYGAPIGTPIYAAADGTVVATDNQDAYCNKGAYGKYVAIRHDNGLATLYGHMSLQVAKEGQRVKRGQVIGYVGKTGFATGPHLHFTVYDAKTFRIGPSNYCGPKMPFGGDLNPGKYLAK
jgi:murein DD-endopeptidase MepM/ murein hydrolase activator NlpD